MLPLVSLSLGFRILFNFSSGARKNCEESYLVLTEQLLNPILVFESTYRKLGLNLGLGIRLVSEGSR